MLNFFYSYFNSFLSPASFIFSNSTICVWRDWMWWRTYLECNHWSLIGSFSNLAAWLILAWDWIGGSSWIEHVNICMFRRSVINVTSTKLEVPCWGLAYLALYSTIISSAILQPGYWRSWYRESLYNLFSGTCIHLKKFCFVHFQHINKTFFWAKVCWLTDWLENRQNCSLSSLVWMHIWGNIILQETKI